jgi:hypothetical protein
MAASGFDLVALPAKKPDRPVKLIVPAKMFADALLQIILGLPFPGKLVRPWASGWQNSQGALYY